MMECKNSAALPILYEVELKDVEHQLGLLGERFWSRKKRVDEKVVDEWEKSLTEIRTLKGWDFKKDVGRYEGDLVNLVIIKVLIELKKAFEVVFTEHRIEDVMILVYHNSSTTFIVIYGMGGIGKTACAKVIYNKLADQCGIN